MTADPIIRPYATMLADNEAGVHDLPPEIVASHKALKRLDAELQAHSQTAPDPIAAETQTVAAIRKAASTGKPLPAVAVVRETREAHADHEQARRLLAQAREATAADLSGLIQSQAEAIVIDYLRPVHDQLVRDLEAAAAVLPAAPTVDALMRADDTMRAAWLSLDSVVAKRARLVDTAGRLTRLVPVEHDHAGEFSYLRNGLRSIWPEYQVGLKPPWSNTDDRLTLLALIRHGGELWLPTSRERDEAWLAVYGEKLEQANQGRANLRGFAAAFG